MKEALVDVSVLILFFNRPNQLGQVFEQVKKARPSRLFLYQDGPRSEKDMPGILACRQVVSDIDWECEVHTAFQEKNSGCDPSNYLAQKWAFSISDKCIALEDDSIPSVSFFHFCKEMLDKYENDPRVTMITGFNLEEETKDIKEDYFFSAHLCIWGWASWRRVLDQWDEHYTWLDDEQAIRHLQAHMKERGIRDDFLRMSRRHRDQNKAFYESIFWSHLMLNNGLCITPRRNLINNLGATADSTHYGSNLNTLPRGFRRIFTMKRFELDAYSHETTTRTPLVHPKYIIEHIAYRHRAYRILGWMCPWVKVARSFEELFLNLRYGNLSAISTAIKNRLKKWMGRKEYN
ncbi:MAG: hemolysin activation protein [Bacteroidaceae bacterium]|nr:hemolysin activation protein [Bacteroidaceae bacterium]